MVTLQEFQQFLEEVQRDPLGDNEQNVSQFMRDFLQVFMNMKHPIVNCMGIHSNPYFHPAVIFVLNTFSRFLI